MGRLDGKVAIVTGSARGMGAVSARLFAAEGAKVVIADILDDRGKATAQQLGSAAMYVHLDITREEDWKEALALTVRTYGPPTVLVNNAAILHKAPLTETSTADFDRVIQVNARGTFLGIRSVVEPMKAAGGGSIINISSVSGLEGTPQCIAYVASKWAVRGISRVAAMELGVLGIRVNTICGGGGSSEMRRPFLPPGVDNETSLRAARAKQAARLAPLGGVGLSVAPLFLETPTQFTMAHMTLFLASDESHYCHGADFLVDTGKFAAS